jgi:hypothetical protein
VFTVFKKMVKKHRPNPSGGPVAFAWPRFWKYNPR